MEEKYKKFKEFDWVNSKDWQSYYRNLYPTPPPSKIERYKKKFYKLKIDNDFDIDYNPPEQNTNTNTNSNTNTNYSNYNTQYNFQSFQGNPINSILLLNIETLILFFFTFSLIFNYHSLKLCCIAFLIRTFRQCGMPQFNIHYLQVLIGNDAFHILMYSLVLFIDRFNYFIIFPSALTSVINICENLKILNNQFLTQFNKYFDIVISKKTELIQDRAHAEVAIGFLLIPGIFLKLNSFLLPIIYWQFMKVKYTLNPQIRYSFSILNQYTNQFKNSSNCPSLVKFVIEKIQWLLEYMGKIETPPSGQQQQSGSKCSIF